MRARTPVARRLCIADEEHDKAHIVTPAAGARLAAALIEARSELTKTRAWRDDWQIIANTRRAERDAARTEAARRADPERIKAAILAALTVDPGMGGPAEFVWETYKPEGVAVVLTEAVVRAALSTGEDPT